MRASVANYLPLYGPLLASDIVPSFEDVDKLIQNLALIQGLLLSCLAACFTEAYECDPHQDRVDEFDVVSWAVFAFDCLCLGILLSLVLYAYLVYFIDQSNQQAAQEHIKKFWQSGGKVIFAILVSLTLIGAGCWSRQVHLASDCMYGHRYGFRFAGVHLLPWMALFACIFIHYSFHSVFMRDAANTKSEHEPFEPLPQTDQVDTSR